MADAPAAAAADVEAVAEEAAAVDVEGAVAIEAASYPSNLLLQWHITNRCNLRCRHCYQDDYGGDELDLAALTGILDQYIDFLNLPVADGLSPLKGHINVTGGEPFVREDFFGLLELFAAHRTRFSFAILSNGSLLDDQSVQRLVALGPRYVQVSVEGEPETHDRIRGKGSFSHTVDAVRLLVKYGIRSIISFTAHKGNFREFPSVARLGVKLKASRVWADRIIPCGSGAGSDSSMLTPEETREFFHIMEREKIRAERSWFNRTEIAMHRALQFLVAGGKPYRCVAGDRLVTVMPNGDLYPCRRMPVSVGNLRERSFTELYFASPFLQALRSPDKPAEGCGGCLYENLCRGGLRCLSYAVYSNPFHADPGCWHAQVSSLESLICQQA